MVDVPSDLVVGMLDAAGLRADLPILDLRDVKEILGNSGMVNG